MLAKEGGATNFLGGEPDERLDTVESCNEFADDDEETDEIDPLLDTLSVFISQISNGHTRSRPPTGFLRMDC